MTESETSFADQIEREFKALQECWDRLRTNPRFLETWKNIRRAQGYDS
jgi:hypothetical protein